MKPSRTPRRRKPITCEKRYRKIILPSPIIPTTNPDGKVKLYMSGGSTLIKTGGTEILIRNDHTASVENTMSATIVCIVVRVTISHNVKD